MPRHVTDLRMYWCFRKPPAQGHHISSTHVTCSKAVVRLLTAPTLRDRLSASDVFAASSCFKAATCSIQASTMLAWCVTQATIDNDKHTCKIGPTQICFDTVGYCTRLQNTQAIHKLLEEQAQEHVHKQQKAHCNCDRGRPTSALSSWHLRSLPASTALTSWRAAATWPCCSSALLQASPSWMFGSNNRGKGSVCRSICACVAVCLQQLIS